MFSVQAIVEFFPTPIIERAKDAGFRNTGHAAASIRKTAIESMEEAEGPSPPGEPPHTHTSGVTRKGRKRPGVLPKSITFDNDRESQTALIGPRFSVVGLAGEAHEFGGEFRGDDYPERPFMEPALMQNIDRFASDWAGSIGE